MYLPRPGHAVSSTLTDADPLADPATRDLYERHFAELPRIYKADKSIHKRLNRRSKRS